MKNDLETPQATVHSIFGQARQNEALGRFKSGNQQRGRLFKICPQCGAKNPGSREFCSVDGVALDQSVASDTELPPVEQTEQATRPMAPEPGSAQPELEKEGRQDVKKSAETAAEIKRFSNWKTTNQKVVRPKQKAHVGVWLGFSAVAAAVLWFAVTSFQNQDGWGFEPAESMISQPVGIEASESSVLKEPNVTSEVLENAELADTDTPLKAEATSVVADAESLQQTVKPAVSANGEAVEIVEQVPASLTVTPTEVPETEAVILPVKPAEGTDDTASSQVQTKESPLQAEGVMTSTVFASLNLGKEKMRSDQVKMKEKSLTRNASGKNAKSDFQRELEELVKDNGFDGFSVSVSGENIVTLKGVVSDAYTKEGVLSLVREYEGVVRVKDKIFVFE